MEINTKNLKGQVEWCLRNKVATRDSDISLMIEVWQRFHGVGSEVPVEHLYGLPREDAIKRIRATFNEKMMYLPTNWQIAQRRGVKEDQWRQALGYPVKEAVVEPTRNESYMDEQRKTLFSR